MQMKRTLILLAATVALCSSTHGKGTVIATATDFRINKGELTVGMELSFDSLSLGTNEQLFVTPVLCDSAGNSVQLPTILANGRNMHIAYERGTIDRNGTHDYALYRELRRVNGKSQSVDYNVRVSYQPWMVGPTAALTLATDSCGCGVELGSRVLSSIILDLNPARCMTAAYITPQVTELPVTIHEGRARVQFEVNRTDLHPEPYTCRNGQRIDNRAQLRVIEDSIRYALADPNVEIASINICGYASPESPYLHNEELSTGRSRALVEYIARKHNISIDRTTYSAVPENWKEFREIVVNASELTEQQRADLIELIDSPVYSPADYDAKEKTLKTDKRFAALYRSTILPEWFPKLRCTEFQITTRLKPLSDEELAKVIITNPHLMSLNQMMRVARLYPEGSSEFENIIATARQYYPNDETATLNAAVTALRRNDNAEAERLLARCGDSPEAENARGILAARRADFKAARSHFTAAGDLPEALRNLNCMEGF